MKLRPSLLLSCLVLGVTTAALRAQTAPTVINSLPYTISAPGSYVLGTNLSYSNPSGNAITFAVGNVILDFAGHFISGLGAGSGTGANGLYAVDRANITVQNGSIVGFQAGILFTSYSSSVTGSNNVGNVITNMRLPSNTLVGISLNIPVTCRVDGCQINKTGGSTYYGNFVSAQGIFVAGGSVTIRNNQISTSTGQGGAVAYGIECLDSAGHFVVGNQVDTCTYGIYVNNVTAKYQDNLTANCTTPFSGGVDAGGNN